MHHGWFNQRVVENTIKDLDSILLSCIHLLRFLCARLLGLSLSLR